MKNYPTSIALLITLIISCFAHAEADEKKALATKYFQQGEAAVTNGDFPAAKNAFKEVLKIYPSHPQTITKLTQIAAASKTFAKDQTVAKLKSVIIPKFDAEGISLREALDMLIIHIDQASEKKVVVNFFVNDPAKKLNTQKVTLNVSNMPADAILTYIAEQTRTRVKYDPHAIVLTPMD